MPFSSVQDEPSLPFNNTASSNVTVRANVVPQSDVVEAVTELDQRRFRLLHLLQLESFAGYHLALQHFNRRNDSVVSDLRALTDGCNLYLTMDEMTMHDESERETPLALSRLVYQQVSLPTNSTTKRRQRPGAIVGPSSSSTAEAVATVANGFGLPMMSPSARTPHGNFYMQAVPSNKGEATVLAWYYKHTLQVRHVGVVYWNDSYGCAYYQEFAQAARRAGLHVASASFAANDRSLSRALETMEKEGRRYIFAVVPPDTETEWFLEQVRGMDMLREDYVWTLSQTNELWNVNDDGAVVVNGAGSLRGVGMVGLRATKTTTTAAAAAATTSPSLGNPLAALPVYEQTAYDTVMAIGIAACQTAEYFLEREALQRQILQTTFEGASGRVSFDSATGTRLAETMQYSIRNYYTTNSSRTVATATFDSAGHATVSTHFDYVHLDGTTTAPPDLPQVSLEVQTIPTSVLMVAWVLFGLIVVAVLDLGCFVVKYRKKSVVRAAQPVFLAMVLVGTLLMGASLIPMTLQEPVFAQHDLSIACMTTPWLFVMGFSTAFSAVFAKTWRINRLFHSSVGMKRVHVRPRDVLQPFVVITSINVVLLVVWTYVAPWVWKQHYIEDYDRFGRPTQAYGVCGSTQLLPLSGWDLSVAFVTPLVVVNFVLICFANYQSFQTRHMPTEFNEAFYHALVMAALLEAFLIGVPTLIVVREEPQVNFVVRTFLISLMCGAVLVPLFMSKATTIRSEAAGCPGQPEWQADWGPAIRRASLNRSSAENNNNNGGRRSSFGAGSTASQGSMPSSVAQLRANIEFKQRLQQEQDVLAAAVTLQRLHGNDSDDDGGAGTGVAASALAAGSSNCSFSPSPLKKRPSFMTRPYGNAATLSLEDGKSKLMKGLQVRKLSLGPPEAAMQVKRKSSSSPMRPRRQLRTSSTPELTLRTLLRHTPDLEELANNYESDLGDGGNERRMYPKTQSV